MITVEGKTTIAKMSDLRNQSEKIISSLKDHKVILEKHNKPVAVMVDYKKYEYLEKMLELAEDYVLGMMAAQRDKKSSKSDFIDIEKW
jgi:prevent-host-death family protein